MLNFIYCAGGAGRSGFASSSLSRQCDVLQSYCFYDELTTPRRTGSDDRLSQKFVDNPRLFRHDFRLSLKRNFALSTERLPADNIHT